MGLLGRHVLFVTSLVLLPFVTVTFYDHCTMKESVEVRTKSGLAGGKPLIFALLPLEHLTSVYCFCTLVDFQNFEYLEIHQKSRYLKLEDLCPIFRLMPINWLFELFSLAVLFSFLLLLLLLLLYAYLLLRPKQRHKLDTVEPSCATTCLKLLPIIKIKKKTFSVKVFQLELLVKQPLPLSQRDHFWGLMV